MKGHKPMSCKGVRSWLLLLQVLSVGFYSSPPTMGFNTNREKSSMPTMDLVLNLDFPKKSSTNTDLLIIQNKIKKVLLNILFVLFLRSKVRGIIKSGNF